MTTATAVPSVRRLAQYRPFARGGLDLRAVIKDLVLAAAAINDGPLGSLFDCKSAFEDLWNLQVEIDELRPVVDGLVRDGALAKSGKTFALSVEKASELKARAREWEETEQRAFREWELAVRKTHPQVSDEELTLLGQDLRSWLHQIISRHGAEAAMMLYPEQERARKFFEALDAHGFEQLPERAAELCALREEALPLFVRCATPAQRQFLAGLLNTSFYMCVLTIDPEAKHLVQVQMTGQRIYLDTNFLYAVIGAAPPQEVYSSRRLVKMCKDLGFELAYTPWTESELRTSIAAARRVVDREKSFVRSELAETMLRVSGDKGFTRYFWQIYQEKGTKPEDVFDRLEHFDADLDRMGVMLVKDGCQRVERQEERIQDYAQLLNRIRWPEYKEWVVLEHDAKCRLLVEQQRGSGNIRVSNAGYWFLTYDGKLPRFAKQVPENGDHPPELPFCISPSAWLQVVRALTPRTEDFDRTVVDLLTSPFVGYRRAVNPALVQEVVGRIDHFEDASPEMAVAVLTDSAKIHQIEEAIASEDEDTIEQTVEAAYSAKAREMEAAVAASEERAAVAEQARSQAEARTAEVEAARARDQEAADEALRQHHAEWKAERDDLHDQLAKATSAHDEAAQKADERLRKLEEWREKHSARRQRNLRILTGSALIIIGAALALVLSLAVLSNRWAIAGAAVGGAGVALAGVRMVLPSRIASEFWLWGGVLVGLAAVAAAIAAASPH